KGETGSTEGRVTYRYIGCRRLTPWVGAELSNVDLSQPLPAMVIAEIRHALVEHGVVGFRGQLLSVEQQIAFAAQFGELYIHPVADKTSRHPEILPVYADEKSERV